MGNNRKKLELTWIGKENRPKLEPRILLEDREKSYHASHRVTDQDCFDNRLIFGDNLLALKSLEQEFTGKVKSIDNLARPVDRDSPVKYFQTIVALDKNDKELMKPGVKLKAQVRAGDLKNVIVIPRSAVVKKDADHIVYIVTGAGRFEPVKVKLGQGDLIQVVVTDGLQAGQTLALNPPDVKRETKDEAKKEK